MTTPLLPTQQDLWTAAESIKHYTSVRLPRLEDWNYDACEHHDEPRPDCEYRLCGGDLFDHQKVGTAWLFAVRRGLLASETGTGKTGQILAVLCLAKQQEESLRSLVVVPTTSVAQWRHEFGRFAPGLQVAAVSAGMSRAERIALYASPFWDCLVIGYHLAQRDADALEMVEARQFVADDVDPLLTHKNATHKALVRLSQHAERVIIANATSVQTRLSQLHAATVPLGGPEVWGNQWRFEQRFLQKQKVSIRVGRRQTRKVWQTIGYQNLQEFKRLFAPMQIRHRYEDLTDLRIPDIFTEDIFLELLPEQRRRYELLQRGVLELLRDRSKPPEQRRVAALAAWTHGAAICAGLPALRNESDPASSKLDWTMQAVQQWADRKVVVYIKNQGLIREFHRRLEAEGIGYSTIWGPESDKDHRANEVRRFWEDPECRVMILSAAGERSLNLQNASVLVLLDTQLNPARVRQTMGRIRRAGSPHDRVFVFSLLASETQEERYLTALAGRQALADFVNDEDHSELFGAVDPDELMRMIIP